MSDEQPVEPTPSDRSAQNGNGDQAAAVNVAAVNVVAEAQELAEQHEELSAAQGTENYIETYHAISEWIRFADAKAAVILTVGGALAGFLIPTIHKVITPEETVTHLFPGWQITCLVLFGLYSLFFVTSGILSFMCINPLRSKGRHPSLDHCTHFHPAAIASAYRDEDVERFVNDCEQMGINSLKREVQAAILLDSHISNKKYNRVRLSLIHFAISVVFGFAYFLTAQL